MVKESDIKAGAIFEKRNSGILVQEVAIIKNDNWVKSFYLSSYNNPCEVETDKMGIKQIAELLNHIGFEPTNRMVTFG